MSTASSVKTGAQVYRPRTTLYSLRQSNDDVCGPSTTLFLLEVIVEIMCLFKKPHEKTCQL
jgi:hypothetical protein